MVNAMTKNKTKKTTAKKSAKKTEAKKATKCKKTPKRPSCTFVATIKTSPLDCHPELNEVTVTLDSDETELLWDDVVDAVYATMDKDFPMDCYPKAEIHEVFILDRDDKEKRYPVVRSDDADKIGEIEKSKGYEKFLELPEAMYSLTPEYALFLRMQNEGLVSEGIAFDGEKMRRLLDNVKDYFTQSDDNPSA